MEETPDIVDALRNLVGKPISVIYQPILPNGRAETTVVFRGALDFAGRHKGGLALLRIHDGVRGPVTVFLPDLRYFGPDPYPSACIHCRFAADRTGAGV